MIQEGRLLAVEDVSAIGREALRLVKIVCSRPPAPETFAKMAGINEMQISDTTLKCRVKGTLGELLSLAAEYEIVDVISREPSLEEFFLAHAGGWESKWRSDRAR